MDANAKTSYEKIKPSIYKWRENNKEKYNIICNKAQAIYYVKNFFAPSTLTWCLFFSIEFCARFFCVCFSHREKWISYSIMDMSLISG